MGKQRSIEGREYETLRAKAHQRATAKYDVVERIDSKKFDNWSADALAEVTDAHRDGCLPTNEGG